MFIECFKENHFAYIIILILNAITKVQHTKMVITNHLISLGTQTVCSTVKHLS